MIVHTSKSSCQLSSETLGPSRVSISKFVIWRFIAVGVLSLSESDDPCLLD